MAKSKLFCSRNVQRGVARKMSRRTEVALTNDLGKYLGMPVLHQRVSRETYSGVLDKVYSRLAGWKRKCLSFAARVTLIQSVLAAIPTYAMQTARLPSSVIEELQKCIRGFFVGRFRGWKENASYRMGEGGATQN